MSDDATKHLVYLPDNMGRTWCAHGHLPEEIDLEKIPDRKVLSGDCPRCARRYASKQTAEGPTYP